MKETITPEVAARPFKNRRLPARLLATRVQFSKQTPPPLPSPPPPVHRPYLIGRRWQCTLRRTRFIVVVNSLRRVRCSFGTCRRSRVAVAVPLSRRRKYRYDERDYRNTIFRNRIAFDYNIPEANADWPPSNIIAVFDFDVFGLIKSTRALNRTVYTGWFEFT